MSWVAAYNIHLREWHTGGKTTDYDQAHYDVFIVPAKDRDQAKSMGQAARRKHMALSKRQQALLMSILDEPQSTEDEKRLQCMVSVNEDEKTAARRLADLGLLAPCDDGFHEVCLTAAAFNPSLLAKVRA